MTTLYSLTIKGTPLSALPDTFGQLGSLNNLTLHSAQICALPHTFGHLSALQSLRLEDCPPLASLPSIFGGLVLLDYLKLRALPHITELPPSFGHLGSLQKLEIQEVGLTSLECLVDLPTLSDLEIKGCSGLPESWGKMGRWMHRVSTSRMTITFAPPQGGEAEVSAVPPGTDLSIPEKCKVM